MHPKYLPWIWFYPLPVPWLKPYLQRMHGCISSSALQSILYVSPRAHDDIIVVATVTMMSSCTLVTSQHWSIMANHLLLHQGGSFPGQVELTLVTAQPPAAIRRYNKFSCSILCTRGVKKYQTHTIQSLRLPQKWDLGLMLYYRR